MPLSNLALVFGPTLSMHPNIFRLLVQTQDNIFKPMPSTKSNISSKVNADQSTEESEEDKTKQAPLLHQRSMSDMKLVHLTEMSRNKAFGRTPSAPLAPLSCRFLFPHPRLHIPHQPPPPTCRPKSHISIQIPLLRHLLLPHNPPWRHGGGRAGSMCISFRLSFLCQPHYRMRSMILSSSSSVPFRSQRDRQGITTSTIDEEHDTAPSRSRTPSTLHSLGTLLSSRSRSNTSPGGPILENGAAENAPSTPTLRNGDAEAVSSGSSTPVRLSRRSSSFFPTTPRVDKLEWGFSSRSGGSFLLVSGKALLEI